MIAILTLIMVMVFLVYMVYWAWDICDIVKKQSAEKYKEDVNYKEGEL